MEAGLKSTERGMGWGKKAHSTGPLCPVHPARPLRRYVLQKHVQISNIHAVSPTRSSLSDDLLSNLYYIPVTDGLL